MNAPATPSVSVVVPTYKRPALLARCLAALSRQDFPRDAYEVLVCDDAASAATRRQVEGLRRAWGGMPALRYLPVSGTRGRPAPAISAGAAPRPKSSRSRMTTPSPTRIGCATACARWTRMSPR